ncbi:MAG: Dyp-type peroxidase [Nitriliruptorales bacterium]|nr:Dyp-type peroxidase [Nitriliruptorales bacterium]
MGLLDRREFLIATAAAGVALASGSAALTRRESTVGLPPSPPGLPLGQHSWEAVLREDRFGNPQLPTYNRLLFFDLADRPSNDAARHVERSFRSLEHRYAWAASGAVFAVGWGPRYFRALGVPPPVADPTALSTFEAPELGTHQVVMHLASDRVEVLDEIEGAVVRGARLPGIHGDVSLAPALRWRETRTGFTGPGLAAAHQRVHGIPEGHPVPPDSPMFMGFRSGFRKNQATEEAVTITDGPLAGGTTMHVSQSNLALDNWYRLFDTRARAHRMFSPGLTTQQVDELGDEAPHAATEVERHAEQRGVVGHLQLAAMARRGDRPIILRRDFNTVDGDVAGLHFVAYQRSIADFEATRKAMNGADVVDLNPAIKPRINNGIKEFFTVERRANFVVPPRPLRSFPLLPGRDLGERS